MTITYKNSTKQIIDIKSLTSLAEQFLSYMKVRPNTELELLIVGSQRIRTLNKQYRHIDKPTDVLSFPLQTPEILQSHTKTDTQPLPLGSIVICPDYAEHKKMLMIKSDTPELALEIKDLLIHGLLHLVGYDHQEDNDYDRWEKTIKQFWLRTPRH